eukprot:COSAG01_NODE_4351_length_5111_cov_2.539689_7_plen_73_part_00
MRGEIMGPRKYEIVGKSQSVLTMIVPMIFTRTRTTHQPAHPYDAPAGRHRRSPRPASANANCLFFGDTAGCT